MVNPYDRLKIRKICNRLGLDKRDSKLMLHIHKITNHDKKNIGVFNTLSNYVIYYKQLPQKDSEHIKDIKKMFTSRDFRMEKYVQYREKVLPKMNKWTLKNMWKLTYFKDN